MVLRLPPSLNPRSSLRARFALLIGGSGLALALLTASVVDGYQRAQLVDLQGQAMRREALLLGRALDVALQQRLQQLRDTADHPLLASGLIDPGEARLQLEALRGQQPALVWVAIVDPQGRVQVATNTLLEGSDQHQERWFTESMRAAWVGPRRPAGALTAHLGLEDGQAPPLIDLGVPMIDMQGRATGVLAARVRWDWLDELHRSMQTPDRHLPGSETLVLDRDGRVLLGPTAWLDRPLVLDGLAALQAGAAPQVLAWPLEGEFVTAWARNDSPADAPDSALTVLVRQPVALAFEAADMLRRRLLLLGLAGTLAFMGLSLWMAARVTRPIRLLSAGAMRVVHDQPPDFAEISPRRTDEVAELARALHALHDELSRRLAEQQRATERYQALFRSAPIAICVTQGARLQLANEACLQLFGTSDLASLAGKTLDELWHPEDRDKLAARQQQQRQRRPHDPALPPLEHRIVRLDGSIAEVESTALPLAEGNPDNLQVVLRDVTEQRQAQAQLRQREAQLLLTSRMARVGGWTLDITTQRASWTDEMAHIYEVPPETPVTPALALSYFQGDDLRTLKAALDHLLEDGQPYDLELRLHPPSGQVKWVRAFARAIRQDGRTVQIDGITQDITERRAAQEALNELNQQLEQRVADRTAELRAANAELDAFAYAVSHDLRAPLRAMSGFSRALVEDHGPQLDADARDMLDQIVQASGRMGDLIEGLLALSRIVRGPLRDDAVDLSALAAQAMDELRRADPERRVQVHIDAGLHAVGDRRMLAAVLGNLLGNAWKYTAGKADASIALTARDIDGERWFCVTDNGAGFDMAHAGRLFKVFARLHRQDEFPGLGIGLATVQRIVHRHGGRIEAAASPGAGASFRFTLPVRRAATSSERVHP